MALPRLARVRARVKSAPLPRCQPGTLPRAQSRHRWRGAARVVRSRCVGSGAPRCRQRCRNDRAVLQQCTSVLARLMQCQQQCTSVPSAVLQCVKRCAASMHTGTQCVALVAAHGNAANDARTEFKATLLQRMLH